MNSRAGYPTYTLSRGASSPLEYFSVKICIILLSRYSIIASFFGFVNTFRAKMFALFGIFAFSPFFDPRLDFCRAGRYNKIGRSCRPRHGGRMHIFLIRHGQSKANTGENYEKRLPDHLVELTERGCEQARTGGRFLAEYCRNTGVDLSRARIWRSPFMRTRQTADLFNESLGITDIREDITLTEQQYGLFDSVPESDWGRLYPAEYAEFLRQVTNMGKFYARLPMGESPFDVAIRIHQFMGTIHRDLERHGIDTLFIFTHGTTLRTFLLRWFHYSPEWYQAERNPKNCQIREIRDGKDLGYIN